MCAPSHADIVKMGKGEELESDHGKMKKNPKRFFRGEAVLSFQPSFTRAARCTKPLCASSYVKTVNFCAFYASVWMKEQPLLLRDLHNGGTKKGAVLFLIFCAIKMT